MSSRSFARSRRLVMAAGTATLIAMLSACASTPTPVSISDTIANTPTLSILNDLLVSSGVAQTLQGPGPFTVFAPSNEAFSAVPAKTMDDLKAHPDKLSNLLKYHTIQGAISAASVAHNAKVKTLNGTELEISRAGEFMTVENAIVTQPDMVASNGLVQVVDTVLMPSVKK